MRGQITNQNGTGAFAEVLDIPLKCTGIQIQARTSQNVLIQFRGQITYWTVKADVSETLTGQFDPGDLYFNAAVGVVVEFIFLTNGISI